MTEKKFVDFIMKELKFTENMKKAFSSSREDLLTKIKLSGIEHNEAIKCLKEFYKKYYNKNLEIKIIDQSSIVKTTFNANDFKEIITKGFAIFNQKDGKTIKITTRIENLFDDIDADVICFIKTKEFYSFLNHLYGKEILKETIKQKRTGGYSQYFLFITIMLLIIKNSYFAIIHSCFTLSIKIYFLLSPKVKIIPTPKIKQESLKKYAVLIPIYKEKEILPQLVLAMNNLHYPKELLDIKFIIEKDDIGTKNALNKIKLADHMSIVEVPDHRPKNKPKALNYACHFVNSHYITIYDAEGIPDPKQLLEASHALSSKNITAAQAKLSCYNYKDGDIELFSAIDYNNLFKKILTGCDKLKIFIPFGGTSNHFKFEEIKQNGFWNIHNVTEDFELSIKMQNNKENNNVCIIDSFTEEESVATLSSWIKQRTRWLKGYIVTIAENLNSIYIKRMSFRKILGININCWSNIIMPITHMKILLNLVNHNRIYLTYICLTINLLYNYISIYIFKKTSLLKTIKAFLLYTAYNMLHIIVFFRAFYQLFILQKSIWEKTTHLKAKTDC